MSPDQMVSGAPASRARLYSAFHAAFFGDHAVNSFLNSRLKRLFTSVRHVSDDDEVTEEWAIKTD